MATPPHHILSALHAAFSHAAQQGTKETSGSGFDALEAAKHRISLVLLQGRPSVVLSQEQVEILEEDVAAHMLAASQLISQTVAVSQLLGEAGIPHLVFKGAALGALQGSASARGAGDIDLLVDRKDVGLAAQALEALGYRFAFQVPPLESKLGWKLLTALDRETLLAGPPVVVDLHWRISPQRRLFLSPRELLQRGQRVTVGGTSVSTVSAGDALAFACFHAYYDRFSQLRALVDVHRLIPVAAQHPLPPMSHPLQRLVAGVLSLYRDLFPGIYAEEIESLLETLPKPLGHVRVVWQRYGGDEPILRLPHSFRNIWHSFVSDYVLDNPWEAPVRFIGKRLFYFPPRSGDRRYRSLASSFWSQLFRIVKSAAD